jgi:threonine dehydratase
MTLHTLTAWPVSMDAVFATRARIERYLPPTPLRRYRQLDEYVGGGIEIHVKHENHQPTNSFKIRNGLSFMTSLGAEQLERGVVAASTGNHGQGIAYAGALLGADVTICVPVGNNREKNAAMRSYGAQVVEEGRDYDDAVQVMLRIARENGQTVAHSTNDPAVVAGAATMTVEILEREPQLDALILAVGGGSQAVGALTVARAMRPSLEVFGVQAAGASAIHDSWHAREPRTTARADTFAEGVATRSTYELTFPTLLEGLAGFITVTDAEIASAMRVVLAATHNLVEGAGAMGLAGLLKLRDHLAGKRVGIVFCGGNIDTATLRRVLNGEL